jgi:DNA uptake protein ComE-like DNA-binding protein
MNSPNYRLLPSIFLLAALTACTRQQDSRDLKEKTAEATAEAKSNAKAVAEGIREGWNRDKPLDLNAATREQLLSLPGLTSAEADSVIAGRPYTDSRELVTRRIVSQAEYGKIATRVTAKR